MAKTTWWANQILNAVRGTVPTIPVTPSIGLFTVAPTAAYTAGSPTGTEVTGTGYARTAVTFGAAAGGSMSNSAQLTFAAAGGAWTAANYFGVFDAAGNLYAWNILQGTNEVQSLALAGTTLAGTYTLSFGGQTTAAIPETATAAQVQEFLEELSTIGAGNVTVTGATMTATGGTYTITFTGALQYAGQALITIASGGLTGTVTTAAVTRTTGGASGARTAATNDVLSFGAGTLTLTEA